MDCQDVAAHVADYLAGSLPVNELEALLTHAAVCVACRDKLTAAGETLQQSAMRRRFDAVVADYQDGRGGQPRNRRLPRCATCHFPGQSCSWICRRRFTAD